MMLLIKKLTSPFYKTNTVLDARINDFRFRFENCVLINNYLYGQLDDDPHLLPSFLKKDIGNWLVYSTESKNEKGNKSYQIYCVSYEIPEKKFYTEILNGTL